MNIKKIGLSALAGSLVAFSANAGEMTVTGAAGLYMTTGNETSKTTFSNSDHVNFDGSTVSAVPVPAAAWLFGSALAGLTVIRRRK